MSSTEALRIRMKSALITLKSIQADHGSHQQIKYGTGGYMAVSVAISKTHAAAKKQGIRLGKPKKVKNAQK